jgi:hypothetical protein
VRQPLGRGLLGVTERATNDATVLSLMRSMTALAIVASSALGDCLEPSSASIISGVRHAHESAMVCIAGSASAGFRFFAASSAVRIKFSSAATRTLTLTSLTDSDCWK